MTAFSVSSFATSAFWTGAADDGNWSNINNWETANGNAIVPASAPGAGELATFDESKGATVAYPTTNIPVSVGSPVNVTATSNGAAATVSLPAMTIGTLIVNNGGSANNVLLQFSGPLGVKTAVTVQTTVTSGTAKLDLNGNTLSGVNGDVADVTVDVDAVNAGAAEILDTAALSVEAINITVDVAGDDTAKLTSGGTITATGAILIQSGAAGGDATLTASGNINGTSLTLDSQAAAGVPTLNIQTFDLTLSGALTFDEGAAANGDPAFSSTNSTISVGSVVADTTAISLSNRRL